MNVSESEFAKHHEAEFVRSFLKKSRRSTYTARLSKPKSRAKLLDRLNHRFAEDVDDQYWCQSPNLDCLDLNGRCYMMAYEDRFDGRILDVSEAEPILEEACFGIIISYSPGRLAAYKDEIPSVVRWLQRQS